ncbi:MAG TPA: glutathione S-transferase [Deltaproteobacteria bacterium]|nr:glutathione S-transferase [Deltaproteobacteria bacterium]
MSDKLKLIIGNKNYSSWSLRPWLLLKQVGADFEEVLIPLYQEDSREKILQYSPSGKVPVLINNSLVIWESLAIAEYLAEQFPTRRLWPEDAEARAIARSVSSEMHAGFAALRSELPMNVRRRPKSITMSEAAQADTARIQKIWKRCRSLFGAAGPYLFGEFSIADAMFAPVVFRFNRYAVPLENEASTYAETVLELPAIQEWIAAAEAESWVIAEYER